MNCCAPNTWPVGSLALTQFQMEIGSTALRAGAAPGACEHQPIETVRVPQRELDADHGAHRQAQQVGAMDVEGVEQTGDVVSHVGDGVGVIGPGAAPGIAVVDEDDTGTG